MEMAKKKESARTKKSNAASKVERGSSAERSALKIRRRSVTAALITSSKVKTQTCLTLALLRTAGVKCQALSPAPRICETATSDPAEQSLWLATDLGFAVSRSLAGARATGMLFSSLWP